MSAAHGQLISFGMDFSEKLLSHHSSIFVAIPYLLLVVASVGLQYLQMSRLNARNPGASQANPQAAMLQKYMPLIFGFIYINVAAILNVYFIVSSAIRILTQEILFRRGIVGGPPTPPTLDATATEKKGPKGPVVDRTERALPKSKAGAGQAAVRPARRPRPAGRRGPTGPARRRPTELRRRRSDVDASATVKRPASTNGANGKKAPSASNGNRPGRGPAKPSGNGSNGASGGAAASSGSTEPKSHPRSKAKRERKAR